MMRSTVALVLVSACVGLATSPASAQERLVMPNVEGEPLPAAQEMLDEVLLQMMSQRLSAVAAPQNLRAALRRTRHVELVPVHPGPFDRVVRQFPPEGTPLEPSTPIVLVAGDGVPREFVPSMVSRPAREAVNELRELGFQVNTEVVPVVDRPPGFVFAQAPREEVVPLDTPVQFFVTGNPERITDTVAVTVTDTVTVTDSVVVTDTVTVTVTVPTVDTVFVGDTSGAGPLPDPPPDERPQVPPPVDTVLVAEPDTSRPSWPMAGGIAALAAVLSIIGCRRLSVGTKGKPDPRGARSETPDDPTDDDGPEGSARRRLPEFAAVVVDEAIVAVHHGERPTEADS